MSVESLVAFNLALLAAVMSPGPALLVAVRTTLSNGRTAGMAVGAGLALVASAWTLTALLGLDAVLRAFPWAYGIAKAVGAIYLIYIAIRMWLGANDNIDDKARAARHAFRDGILINLLNPKSVLFAAAVLIVVFPGAMTAAENAIVVANHFIVEVLFYGLLAVGMSRDSVRRRYLGAKRYIDRGASVVLCALGVRLLVSR